MRKVLPFLTALLAACGGGEGGVGAADSDDVPEEARFGGTAVIGMIGDIPDINPLTSTDHNAAMAQQFVLFSPLLTYDGDFEPVPYGAESWEVNADTTMLTFHLRPDLRWHDGRLTTAEDWKFTYDMARDPETAFPNTAFWTHYGEATVVDSLTFQVALRPHAEFLDPWRSLTPVPRHRLEGVPAAEMRSHAFSSTQPLGNGPFRFVSHASGQGWTFEANPDFPESMGGPPYLDRLVIRVIPEPSTLLTELLTGGIDFYIQPTPEQAETIEASSVARLVAFADRAFVPIIWNHRRELFSDVQVRRALTMAIDRESIISGVLHGYGELANSTVPPFFWQAEPEAGADLRYDPEEAKRLLAEAGWINRDSDPVLENEAGREFSFVALTNQGNLARADILQVVQADLARVGVALEPRIMEFGSLLDRINDPETRDFDAVLIGWVTEFRIDDSDLFHCEKRGDPYQWAGYCDPRADQLMDTLPTIADREAARPLWSEYQRTIAEDQPYTFLYFQQRLEGVHNRLRNVDPDARGDLVGVARWFIHPEARRPGPEASEAQTPPGG